MHFRSHCPHGQHAVRRPHRHRRPAADYPVPHAAVIRTQPFGAHLKPTGTLHLIPVSLGESAPGAWLPQTAHELASQLSTYIAENAKTARAFLKLIGTTRPLQEITINTLTDKVDGQQIKTWLQPLLDGGENDRVSEPG